MVCVTNGNTINTNCEYTSEFFSGLREKLYFAYDVMRVQRNVTIVKDITAEDKFGNEDFLNALYRQDYDLIGYLSLMLDSFVSISDIDEVLCGVPTDGYDVDNQHFVGEEYTFAELAYENDWCVLSFEPVDIEAVTIKIAKNSANVKKAYYISNIKQFLLCASLKDDTILGEFYSSFDDVYCSIYCSFENWDSLTIDKRFKVLATFYDEIIHIVNNQFQNLRRFPGNNQSRVERIRNNLFEYRIANPNYRIYYTRDNNKIVLLKCMLKRRQTIANTTLKRLEELKSEAYFKLGNKL